MGSALAQAGMAADRFTVFAPPIRDRYGTHHSKFFIIEARKGTEVPVPCFWALIPETRP